jgi:hypothetical protein
MPIKRRAMRTNYDPMSTPSAEQSHDHGDAIRRVALASGFAKNGVVVHDRMYLFEFDENSSEITANPLNQGSHEETWRQFERLLSDLQSNVLQAGGLIGFSQDTFDCLQTVRDILNSGHSRANWLPKVRNNLNYRHYYGAWYPHGEGRHWNDVDALLRTFSADPLLNHGASESKIVVKFAKGCALVVGLFCEMLRDLAARHPQTKVFYLIVLYPSLRRRHVYVFVFWLNARRVSGSSS